MPFINAPPSDLSTIFTILRKLVDVSAEIGQQHILVTADMAIYSKAQQILWANPPSLKGKVTMRLGGMHITMDIQSCIGKIFGDGGLVALLTDSGLYTEATTRHMLQGKNVARCNRAIRIVYEAMSRLFYDALESWLREKNEVLKTPDFIQKLNVFKQAFAAQKTDVMAELATELEEGPIPGIQVFVEEFKAVGRQQSETFTFWDNFSKGAAMLLRLLRSEREGCFELHLNTMCEALPWFRAAGKNNYAKYVPVYISDMKQLQHDHPDSYKHLIDGGFVVRRSERHRFNAVGTDQALEQTINKEGKGQGGIIGLTLKKGALTRWLVTRHTTAEYADAFKTLASDSQEQNLKHKELGKHRMSRDESDVQKVIDVITKNQNPFDLNTVPSELTNIITGRVASTEVARSLNKFLDDGKQKHTEFMGKRLIKSSKSANFWDPESRHSVKTFTDMNKTVKLGKQIKISLDSEVLFRRLLAVSKQREVDLHKVLEHELAAVPPALFHDDGTMRKSTKSDLAKKLEAGCDEVHTLPKIHGNSAYIIDGMAMLQALHESSFQSFDDLGKIILQRIKKLFNGDLGINMVVVVFDRYDQPHSIKNQERLRRGTTGTGPAVSHVITGSRTVPNYRSFLNSAGNKASLAAFVCDFLLAKSPRTLLEGQQLFLAGGFKDGQVVICVEKNRSFEALDLFSTHEEADTRLVLHATDIHLRKSHERVIIRCDDTDVLVILLFYCSKNMLPGLVYMHAGHGGQHTNRERFVPVHTLRCHLGDTMCQALPAMHTITGCDTTCSLFKIGKKTAFNKLQQHAEKWPILATFGTSDIRETAPAVREYALQLYGNKQKETGDLCATLDELRFVYATRTDKPASAFPPTEDAFRQHILRAQFQTTIWTHSHQAQPTIGSPIGKGWKLGDDGELEPVLYSKEAAPVEVRDLTHLYCSDSGCDKVRKCHCRSAGLRCTEFCSCHGNECANPVLSKPDSDSEEEEEA